MEANFSAPIGQISQALDLNNVTGGQRERRPDVILLNHGINVGVIYGIVDLGSHMKSFEGSAPTLKRMIRIYFEHPQLKQLFYVDDTERKSSTSNKEVTFSINDKSFLKKLIEAAEGKTMSAQECVKYNILNLIGKKIGVNIKHQPKKSDPTVFYEKVEGVMSVNGLAIPQPFEPENKQMFFYIDKGKKNFMTENFAALPNWIKNQILESKEATDHIASGGKFAQYEEGQERSQLTQPVQQQGTVGAVQQQGEFIMNSDSPYTEQQLKEAGYSQQQMIDSGYAKRIAPKVVLPPPPTSAIPQPPSVPVLVMNPDSPYTKEALITAGYSEQQIVDSGFGKMSVPNSPQLPTPPLPPAPQQPTPPRVEQSAPLQQAQPTNNSNFLSPSTDDDEDDLPF